MKCPKCHYISFESVERCRNCGYDFSLALELPAIVDLPLRGDSDPAGPLADLSLEDPARPPAVSAPSGGQGAPPHLAEVSGADLGLDLPLFEPDPLGGDDRPLIAPPAAPRAPLAVRRPTPEVVRVRPRAPRSRGDAPRLNLEPSGAARETGPGRARALAGPAVTASGGRRAGAALVDIGLLSAIDVVVIYFTLKLCDLSWAMMATLPLMPLGAFLLILNGGYFVAFTAAGGQTIGKMLMRIKVVGAGGMPGVALGEAVVRTAGYFVSALPVGLGFLPALIGPDRRALHDRLADTRVVSSS